MEWLSTSSTEGKTVIVANHDGQPWSGTIRVKHVDARYTHCREFLTDQAVSFRRAGDGTVLEAQIRRTKCGLFVGGRMINHCTHTSIQFRRPDSKAQKISDMTKTQLLLISALTGWAAAGMGIELPLELRGTAVIPHVQSTEMRYRREADFSLGARVQVFLQNESDQVVSLSPETTVRLRGHSPDELLQSDDWAWHDFPGAWTNQSLDLPPGALTVWSWNGKRASWGTNTDADLEVKLPGGLRSVTGSGLRSQGRKSGFRRDFSGQRHQSVSRFAYLPHRQRPCRPGAD